MNIFEAVLEFIKEFFNYVLLIVVVLFLVATIPVWIIPYVIYKRHNERM